MRFNRYKTDMITNKASLNLTRGSTQYGNEQSLTI